MKSITHSLEHLKFCHEQATAFFGSELILLKDSIPQISDERLAKAAVLLISCGQTGAAILQLANQTDTFTSQAAMLSRAFMEAITNFCYVGICDEQEFRRFTLHPIYKHYHNLGEAKIEDDFSIESIEGNMGKRKEIQAELKKKAIVQEALNLFSESKPGLTWTKKTLNQRIDEIQKWGKLLDVFFTINKIQYYSDASEALHGSLYGSTIHLGVFEPDFNPNDKEELEKRLYKDSACVLIHLGMLVHESFTLISYSSDIKELWDNSYKNRNQALSLLFHILEKKINSKQKKSRTRTN